MKRLLLFILIVLFSFGGLKGQRRGGMGLIDRSQESDNYLTISLGPDYCFADTKALPFSQSVLKNWDLSVGFRKTFANNLGYKFGLDFAEYSGTDLGTTSNRGYSFTSNVLQMSLQAEYNIRIGRRYYYKPTPNAIYFFLGGGVMRSNADLLNYYPRRGFSVKPVDITPFVPLGVGYQYHFNTGLSIGAEFKYEFPLSDYVDGFSPGRTQGSLSNDMMVGFSFTFSYLLGMEYLKRH